MKTLKWSIAGFVWLLWISWTGTYHIGYYWKKSIEVNTALEKIAFYFYAASASVMGILFLAVILGILVTYVLRGLGYGRCEEDKTA